MITKEAIEAAVTKAMGWQPSEDGPSYQQTRDEVLAALPIEGLLVENANLKDMLDGCRSELRDSVEQIAKRDVQIKDLNEMVLRYAYRAENAEALTQPASTAQEVEAEAVKYEARICKGVPADCCDYGVVDLEEGIEVCRVWKEADARLIADLLNGTVWPEPTKDGDDLTECFRHHVNTTIGWQAFGARPGPEMQMYEEGFKAGYRRCQSDNEPEFGEEEDYLDARARKVVGRLRDSLKAGGVEQIDIDNAVDLIVDQAKALARPQPASTALVESAKGLKRIVEEIDGAMNHGTWRDDQGNRLKDTPEWVALYNALGEASK